MPEQSVIVWDLETVPDLQAAARMLNMEGAADEDVRDALGSGFPKHPLHKIACIGALVAERQPEGWQVQALGAPHIGQRTEVDLIRSFIDRIGELRAQLITFNGHSFDLPVLRYRAMVTASPVWGCRSGKLTKTCGKKSSSYWPKSRRNKEPLAIQLKINRSHSSDRHRLLTAPA